MSKKIFDNPLAQYLFLIVVVFVSRLPFLSAGYGSEEDSWLLPLIAKKMATLHIYEVSRAPGHPIQEYMYAAIWNAGAFWYNLLSAIGSVVAVAFFTLAVKELGIKNYLFAGFAFAFTPIVFVSSVYTIDYMMASACVMGSFYFIIRKKTIWAGVMLGLAVGLRLTSAAMALPFAMLLWQEAEQKKKVLIFWVVSIVVSLFVFIPVFKTYAFNFFEYSDQFPYPNFPKLIYKATIGVFGLVGVGAILYFIIKTILIIRSGTVRIVPDGQQPTIFLAVVTTIILYIISYLMLPQKSGYIIPIVPFVILMFAYYLSEKEYQIFCVLLTVSSFLFGINLTDSLRGAKYSPLALTTTIAGQEMFLDPLSGAMLSDYSKRLNKIAYTRDVVRRIRNEKIKKILICGWWYNEVLVEMWNEKKNTNVAIEFYIDKPTIDKYIHEGYSIYYLSEQNIYNDLFYKMEYTDTVAREY